MARLLAVKESRGSRFVITDGGMHHHLAAVSDAGGERAATAVVGPLCTPLDMLARAAPLPSLTEGDLVAVLQSGAYGLTASPTGFLSHPVPAEVLVEGGQAAVIRARG
ncbi:hypothetical protein AFFFEF_02840 [Methylorubrum extorquens]